MTGHYNESYQPLGNLTLTIPTPPQTTGQTAKITNYRRELDLKEGTVKSRYTLDGVPFEREAFASYPDNVLIFQVKSNTPEKVSLDISLSGLLKNTVQTDVPKNRIVLVGNTPSHVDPNYAIGKNPIVYTEGKGMKFMEAVHVVNDGGTLEKENSKKPVRPLDLFHNPKSSFRV